MSGPVASGAGNIGIASSNPAREPFRKRLRGSILCPDSDPYPQTTAPTLWLIGMINHRTEVLMAPLSGRLSPAWLLLNVGTKRECKRNKGSTCAPSKKWQH
jgi:hypothetical protein